MRFKFVTLALLAAFALAVPAHAQLATASASVPMQFNVGESATLSSSSNTINLSTASPAQTVTLTASWQLVPGAHSSGVIYSWFSTFPSGGLSGTMSANFFQTQFNNGAAVACGQPTFNGVQAGVSGIGLSSKDCGYYTLTQNFSTDTVDSVAVPFTLSLTSIATAINSPLLTGNYTGGVLNLALVIV